MFADRAAAASALAGRLAAYRGKKDVIIAGVPPAGAIVGALAAIELDLPFGCSGVYKVPVATRPDATLAVIDMDGEVTLDPRSELTRHEVRKLGASTLARLHTDLERCRNGATEPDFQGAEVIVVEQLALSALVVRAAAACVRRHGASRIVLAAPVMSAEVQAEAGGAFDEVIALEVARVDGDAARLFADHAFPGEEEMLATVRRAYSRQMPPG